MNFKTKRNIRNKARQKQYYLRKVYLNKYIIYYSIIEDQLSIFPQLFSLYQHFKV